MDEPIVMEKPEVAEETIDETVIDMAQEPRVSMGAVRGKVNAIVHTPLAILVIDELFGHIVKCYLDPDQYDLARDVWGKLVSVVGEVHRQPLSGRPLEVRKVNSVEPFEQASALAFQEARGIIPWRAGQEPPEVILRRAGRGS